MSFIDNGGVQLQVIISYLLSVTIFELIYSKLAKKQRKGKMVQTLETARSTLRFTGFIAINNLLYLNLLFASLFQMIYFSFKTTTSTIDFINALLTFANFFT